MGNEKRNTNELIKRRKKKRRIRKAIYLMILLIVVTVILCLKLPYFNISKVEVMNNKIVAREEVLNLAGVSLGENIFYLNKKEIGNKVLSNPYISEVTVRRLFPSTILLDVKERTPRFYITVDKEFLLLDAKGFVLDRVSSIDKLNLMQVLGLEVKDVSKGKRITEDLKRLGQLEAFSGLETRNLSDVRISSVDITDSLDIKVNFNNVTVLVGNVEDMETKLNKAINIISQQKLKDANGYIDISYNGSPVVSVQK